MNIPSNTIDRLCKIFGQLDILGKKSIEFVSSKDLAIAIGTTEYTVRKDISLIGVTGFTRKGYEVVSLKEQLGEKLNLKTQRKACIVGLGRLGTALLDYEKFKQDGFDIVAGFDSSINKIERIHTSIDVFSVAELENVVSQCNIELGIIAVPSEHAQDIADKLVRAGVKGILNFSPVEINVNENIIYSRIDLTNALRSIAARF
ncbi:MAG: redox-sensing transcriptional repressor Rex [Candidatus Omnitrophica bacterium]|nr:redox-sensing transcriptional repressor Rex [Candidatus Omnitrophota bacterium]